MMEGNVKDLVKYFLGDEMEGLSFETSYVSKSLYDYYKNALEFESLEDWETTEFPKREMFKNKKNFLIHSIRCVRNRIYQANLIEIAKADKGYIPHYYVNTNSKGMLYLTFVRENDTTPMIMNDEILISNVMTILNHSGVSNIDRVNSIARANLNEHMFMETLKEIKIYNRRSRCF